MSKIGHRIGRHMLTHYAALWAAVGAVPPLRRWINQLIIDTLASAGNPRPHPYAVWGPRPGSVEDYTCWTGLVDRRWTGRHLPPAEAKDMTDLPALASPAFTDLFRRNGAMIPCPKSSALFGFFAQWFTDSFLRTDPDDKRKNTSNHEIDLCQIYGLNDGDTRLIRSTHGGELMAQKIGQKEYPPFLFESDGLRVAPAFRGLSYVNKDGTGFLHPVLESKFDVAQRRAKFFVSGLERGNSTVFYSALNTVFLREHNRLCRAMALEHPTWDNDRLFETARNTNIAQILKIIIEDYIGHLSPAHFKTFVEVGCAERSDWYRTNRICAEFNLLYRWHQLVPTELEIGGAKVSNEEFRFNNELLISQGLENIIAAGAAQRAGRITLHNTAPFLVDADVQAVSKAREWRVRPYNEYRKHFGLWRLNSFEELTGEPALAAQLQALYETVDRVEFPVGLFAEQRSSGVILGDLMTAMVAADAFSQALTNPLLSEHVYSDACFSRFGRQSIEQTSTLDDVVQRNTRLAPRKASFAIGPAPGSASLPTVRTVIDTIDFLFVSGWHRFFARRRRKHKTTMFRVHLFQPAIAMLDGRAIASLFAPTDLVPDRPSPGFQFQIPPLPLLGGVVPSMFETGAAHDHPKALYQRLLQRRAATLATTFTQTADEFTGRWQSMGRFAWRDELEDLAATFAFRWTLGASPSAADVRYLFGNIFSQWAAVLTRHLPWSSYTRCARLHESLVRFVKSSPAFGEILQMASEEGLADADVVAKQITYFLGNNSFLGLQNLFKSIVGELSLRPKLLDTLRAEIVAAFGAEPRDVDPGRLGELKTLDNVIREILRLHPPVFFLLARATRERVIESASGNFRVAQGDLMLGVIPFAHLDPAAFADPEDFRPDRFNDPQNSSKLIWPRGLHDAPVTALDRTCPGKDVAVLIAKMFCVALLPRFAWELSEPPRWGRHFFSLNVAAPVGPIEVSRFVAYHPVAVLPGREPCSESDRLAG